jgi:hypothetical protein
MIATIENIAPASPELTAVRLPVSLSPSKSVGGKKTAHSKETRETVHALYVSRVPALEIENRTGVPVNTIRKWQQRLNWTPNRDGSGKPADGKADSTIAGELDRRSGEVKDNLSRSLVAQSAILAKERPKTIADVAGEKGKDGRKGLAETSLTVINAAEKLFGWNQGGGPNVLVQIGYLRDLMPETPPAQPACVPVQASVVSAPEQTKP